MNSVKNGDLVEYGADQGRGPTVIATVKRTHRDGSCTVEAQHILRDGERCGAYLGFTYRIHCRDLRAA
jgi:hypothetical protein